MRFPDTATTDVRNRLRRIEGQIRGLQRMIDEGKDCQEIVTQLSAARAALDKVALRLMAAGLKHCVSHPESGMDTADFERLFLKLR